MAKPKKKTKKSEDKVIKTIARVETSSDTKYDDFTDSMFSFRFENTLRIIEIRDGQVFHVAWCDPNHKFFISKIDLAKHVNTWVKNKALHD